MIHLHSTIGDDCRLRLTFAISGPSMHTISNELRWLQTFQNVALT